MNPAHLPDTDSLMAEVADQYDHETPGVQAHVERTAAALADHLGRRGPVTVEVVRYYFARVIVAGMTYGIGPEPTPAAEVLGWELAGAALLRRQLETGRELERRHNHNRTSCSCGTLIYDGWLNPDGTGHQCAFWPPSEAGP